MPAALNRAVYTEGTLGRNAFRGPGDINMDMALAKHLKFFEDKLDAELRLDAFNVFNHANWGNPSGTVAMRVPAARLPISKVRSLDR